MAEDKYEPQCLCKQTHTALQLLDLAIAIKALERKFAKQKCFLNSIGTEEKRNRIRLFQMEQTMEQKFRDIGHQMCVAMHDEAFALEQLEKSTDEVFVLEHLEESTEMECYPSQ